MADLIAFAWISGILWASGLFIYAVVNMITRKVHQHRLKLSAKEVEEYFGGDVQATTLSIFVAIIAIVISYLILR